MENSEYFYQALVIFISVVTAATLLLWELLRSQLRFKAICENSGNMVVIGRALSDRSKRVVDAEIVGCNAVYAGHLGLKIKDVVGMRIIRDLYDGEEPEWFSSLRQSVISHDSRHIEFEYKPLGTRYSGSVFCISPIRKRCCLIMDEISEKYNRKQELEEVRNMMDTVLHLSDIGLWRWNLKTQKSTIIRPASRLFASHAAEEVSKHTLLQNIHPDDIPVVKEFLRTYPEEGHTKEQIVVRVKNHEGNWRWVQSVAVKTEYDENGVPFIMDGVSLDVDSLKRSQLKISQISKELEVNQQHLISTLRQCRTGIRQWDVRTDKVYFEDNFWESIGGLSSGLGVPVPDTMESLKTYVISDEHDAIEGWIKRVREGDKTIDEFNFRCRIAFVPDVWLEVRNSVAERDKSGRPLVINGFVIDITDLKKHEQALENAIVDADDANRAKSRFLAIMSHEIRTPLNAIIGFSSLIKDADIPEQLKSYSGSIKKSGEMLLTLINDLLDLAKIDATKMELSKSPVNLHNLLFELRGLFLLKVKSKGLFLDVKCDDIPVLVLDSKRIKQVMINLIGNAIKFTDKGGVTVVAKVSSSPIQPPDNADLDCYCVEIAVRDTGTGISKDDFDNIFNPFEQAANKNNHYVEGSGLGLAICKNLVDLMGGSITCESQLGSGSNFTVTLESVSVSNTSNDKVEKIKRFDEDSAHIAGGNIHNITGAQKACFAKINSRFGNHLLELENGMHVQETCRMLEELQEWLDENKAPQIQSLTNLLKKAVEDFDVREVRRISRIFIEKGVDDGR